MTLPTPSPTTPLAAFGAGVPATALPWLASLHAAGAERFAALGWPTVRQEAWRYTNLKPITTLSFAPATSGAVLDQVPSLLPAEGRAARLVVVDGVVRPELSDSGHLPAGVRLLGLAQALASEPALVEPLLGRAEALEDQTLAALNGALVADGVVLLVPAGVTVEQPIELVLVGTGGEAPTAWHPRLLIAAGANSSASVVEHHVGLGSGAPYLANVVSEITLERGARLHHVKVQRERSDAFHLSTVAVRIAADAAYDSFVLTLGAALSRNQIHALIDGPGAWARLSGAYLVRGQQHADTTTVIDHAQPQGSSREVYKGAIDDQAQAVFQGKIIVRPDAQKTDGYQLNRALLLSDQAGISAKPELEIYADDVKCSHGATAGELDDQAMFYLRSRGIDRAGARALLTAAFVAEALDEIPLEPVRAACQELVSAWLGQP